VALVNILSRCQIVQSLARADLVIDSLPFKQSDIELIQLGTLVDDCKKFSRWVR
jgi:hypothetical protein